MNVVDQAGVPFMVIESAKTEYRALKRLKRSLSEAARRLGKMLEVYTPGLESLSPVRLNPLEPLPGTSIEEQIEILIGCFQASMPVSGPLPALLREGLEWVYEKHADPQRPPVISDLLSAVEAVLAEKEYSAETNSDIRAALEVRLGILTHGLLGWIFQCRRSVPSIGRLVQTFSVHELDRLPRETACLYTLILLTWVRQYFKSSQPARGTRFVIVIEEAHNIVGRSTQAVASDEGPDPRAFAADFVCRLLAELRALGVAVVVVDQLPSAVAPEVVKNTGSKVAFRQVATDDRAELGGAMLFGKTEMEECARLPTGEAFFSTEGYHGPRRIRAVNLHAELNLTAPQDTELRASLGGEPWFSAAAEARCATELDQLRERMDALGDVHARVATQIAQLQTARCRALTTGAPRQRQARLARLRSEARALKARLLAAQRAFVRGPFRVLLPPEALIPACPDVEEMRSTLVRRFRDTLEPGMKSFVAILERFIALCGATEETRPCVDEEMSRRAAK